MRLGDLLDSSMQAPPDAAGRVTVTGLTADSRAVKPGFLFAALEGETQDGLTYLGKALENGAAAILLRTGRTPPVPCPVPVIEHDNPRLALALLAARFHAGQPETVVAVTGTNGKTSIANFLRQLWTARGHRAASMGTLGVMAPDGPMPLAHTTPDPVQVHQIMKALHDTGTSHLALEASSHGLAQYRLDGVRVRAAGFTNLTWDHLDYHRTFEAYQEAKGRLFTELLEPDGMAVINMAGAQAAWYREACLQRGVRVMTTGTPDSDLALLSAEPGPKGIALEIGHDGKSWRADVPLYGGFQAQNVAVALGLAMACGDRLDDLMPLTDHLTGAPGRMERVAATRAGASVFVDYAHTPDALQNVLAAMRPHVSGKLHVVFGCGGDRDKAKRPKMGKIATDLADRVIVTDDNPRSEDPARIRAEILEAAPGATEIGDRAEAIAAGIKGLSSGDILVVAGKGHETGQIVGDHVHPFNDAEVVRALTATRPASGQGAPHA